MIFEKGSGTIHLSVEVMFQMMYTVEIEELQDVLLTPIFIFIDTTFEKRVHAFFIVGKM